MRLPGPKQRLFDGNERNEASHVGTVDGSYDFRF